MIKKITGRIKTALKNVGLACQSVFWHKDSSIVLIGSWFGEKFADNSRYLFQYLSDNKDDLGLTHVVWVTRSEPIVKQLRQLGYEVYLIGSVESTAYHKKAKYHIICDSYDDYAKVQTDIDTKYSWRSIRVNLWHGVIGFKGVGYGSKEYEIKKSNHKTLYSLFEILHSNSLFRRFAEYSGGWGNCYFLSTTAYRTETLTKYFRLPRNHYIETGFARVAGPVRLLPIEEQVMSIINGYRHFILYLPTFRGANSTFDFHEASTGIIEFLEKRDILWIQKFHSASPQRTNYLKHEGNILSLPHDFDINTIIPLASIMITDYSSVTGDAMYYYKPLIFYVPDIVEYNSGDRGFVINPNDIMCGPKAFNNEDLKNYIGQYLDDEFRPDKKYLTIRNQYFNQEKSLREIWIDIKNNAK